MYRHDSLYVCVSVYLRESGCICVCVCVCVCVSFSVCVSLCVVVFTCTVNLLSLQLNHPERVDGLCLINCTASKAGWSEWGYQKVITDSGIIYL